MRSSAARRALRPRRRGVLAQAMVEFALVSFPFLLVTMGILEFGFIDQRRAVVINNAHDAARFAAAHNGGTAGVWDNSATPAVGSIQQVAMKDTGGLWITNDDAHIMISYWTPGAGAATQCGHYSQASNSFVADVGGATVANCVISGNLVAVKVTFNHQPITPLPAMVGNIQLTATATTQQEV